MNKNKECFKNHGKIEKSSEKSSKFLEKRERSDDGEPRIIQNSGHLWIKHFLSSVHHREAVLSWQEDRCVYDHETKHNNKKTKTRIIVEMSRGTTDDRRALIVSQSRWSCAVYKVGRYCLPKWRTTCTSNVDGRHQRIACTLCLAARLCLDGWHSSK